MPDRLLTASLASAITKAASKQAWYTVTFLVDPPRRADALRAYAYFRWVDDTIDALPAPDLASRSARMSREAFLHRQQRLLEYCLRGERPQRVSGHEAMLVELTQRADRAPSLEAYLRNMMRVMAFDVGRRGRLISGDELEGYTQSLAMAVTEVMHHFIGNGKAAPLDKTRYSAASGAHIMHMLRDTYADLRAGYYNVPRELLEAEGISPSDVDSGPYRAWVESRVRLAREQLEAGTEYFARVESRRLRAAGFAYIVRFEWLVEMLVRDGYRIRPDYSRRRGMASDLRLGWRAITRVSRPQSVRKQDYLAEPRPGRA